MHRMFTSLLGVALLLGSTVNAWAFDTGHHSDCTRDALDDLGLSETAIQVCQVENWLVDYYSIQTKGVDDSIKTNCNKLHADNLFSDIAVRNYWDRFSVNAKAGFQEAARNKNPRQVLALLGMSLHTVQDFYSHSNWPELQRPPAGFDYSTLTYFDAAQKGAVKTGKSGSSNAVGQERHGGYDEGMNHDWYGRPNWDRAYVHAYAGSRQWANQARIWVSEVDPAVWEQAKRIQLSSKQLGKLKSDLDAALKLSLWAKDGGDDGHWKGKGSGDKVEFYRFIAKWVVLTSDSDSTEDFKNRRWHELLSGQLRGALDLAVNRPPTTPAPPITVFPINKRAVYLRTVAVKDLDDADFVGDADMYAKITINNQFFFEPTQVGKSSITPAWTTMKFVDANISTIMVHYEIWDEDTGSGDEHLDINPEKGYDLDFRYTLSTRRAGGNDVSGVFDSPSSLLTIRGNKGDNAEVKFYITTRTLGPAPRIIPGGVVRPGVILQPGVIKPN